MHTTTQYLCNDHKVNEVYTVTVIVIKWQIDIDDYYYYNHLRPIVLDNPGELVPER